MHQFPFCLGKLIPPCLVSPPFGPVQPCLGTRPPDTGCVVRSRVLPLQLAAGSCRAPFRFLPSACRAGGGRSVWSGSPSRRRVRLPSPVSAWTGFPHASQMLGTSIPCLPASRGSPPVHASSTATLQPSSSPLFHALTFGNRRSTPESQCQRNLTTPTSFRRSVAQRCV
jgi:hypothetical protein